MDLKASDVSGISNTINSKADSISSFTKTAPEQFTNRITSTVGSAVGDPIGGPLNGILGKITDVSSLADSKIDDLSKELTNYKSKNGQVQVIGNQIVITVSSADAAKGEAERNSLAKRVSSIQNTLTTLTTATKTLSTLSETVSLVQKLLTIQEAVLMSNPVSAASFTVFKAAMKIVFLGDMVKTYGKIISDQVDKSSQVLNQLTQKFLHLQVTLNVQDESNAGNQVTPDEALSNVTQDLLGGDGIDNQSDTFTSYSNVEYILKVEKLASNQLIGRAYDKATGQLAAQTSPSYISTSDQILAEIKTIVNG